MSAVSRMWRALGAASLGFTLASLLDLPMASQLNLFESSHLNMLLNGLYLLLELGRYR